MRLVGLAWSCGALLLHGCSLTFSLDEYDQGTGTGTQAGAGGEAGNAAGGQGGGVGGGGSPPACDGGPEPPLSSITNDFEAGLGSELAFNSCPTIVDGEVHIEAFPGDYCWFFTTGSHRLRCDGITVRVLEVGNQMVGVHRFIYLREVSGDGAINVIQEGGGFGGDLTFTSTTFSLVQDAWWRLRADETTVYFETSADGVSWNLKGSAVPTFSLDFVNISIGAGNWNNVAAPGLARFDCFNVPPPCGE